MVVVGPIECDVCGQETTLVQIRYDAFICKPCIAVWYEDWKHMRNPWPHMGDENDACDDKPSSL